MAGKSWKKDDNKKSWKGDDVERTHDLGGEDLVPDLGDDGEHPGTGTAKPGEFAFISDEGDADELLDGGDGLDLVGGIGGDTHVMMPEDGLWQAGADDVGDEPDDAIVDAMLDRSSTIVEDDIDDANEYDDAPSDYTPVGQFVPAGADDDPGTGEGSLPPEIASIPIPPPPSLPEPDLASSDGFEEFDPAGQGTVFGGAFDAVASEIAENEDSARFGADTVAGFGEPEVTDPLPPSGTAPDVDEVEMATADDESGTLPIEDGRTIVDDDHDVARTIAVRDEEDPAASLRTDEFIGESRDPSDTRNVNVRGTFLDDIDVGRTIDPAKLPERDREVWRKLIERQQQEGLDTPDEEAAVDRRLIIQQRRVRNSGDSGVELADYEVVNQFAEGGMGRIYLARQQSVNRTVALKMLKPEFEDDARQREGFLSEAVVTSDLDHPNIVPIHDLGRTEDEQLFYSMKLVGGTPWDAVLRKKSLAENLEIWTKVADGVAFAHSRGVVHRDLKPENVMLGDYGEVLVMDWGLAVVTDGFEKPESIRRTNSRGGSPAYMAPEMVTGPVRRIEPRADVYLLGAILFEVVTGHPPHAGSNVSECIRAAAGNVIIPTNKRGELVDIAHKAMSTLPEDRYESVVAMREAVRAYQSHSESLVLSDRAAEELETANESGRYEDYARAVFGFEEAASLWSGNRAAVLGARQARYAYAAAALENEDFDLGLSTLDPEEPEHASLVTKLESGRRASRARQSKIRTLNRVAAGLAALFVIGAGVAIFIVNGARNEALAQKGLADAAAKDAREAEADAKDNLDLALENEQEAKDNLALALENERKAKDNLALANEKTEEANENLRLANTNLAAAKQAAFLSWVNEQKARLNGEEAELQRVKAVDESEKALLAQAEARRQELDALLNGFATSLQEEAARRAADDATRKAIEAAFQEFAAEEAQAEALESATLARQSADEAQRARRAQEYESYIAQIQLVAARIEDGSFRVAANILRGLDPTFYGWEWYRLAHVTRLEEWSREAPTGVRFESVTLHPDGETFAVACDDGIVRLWRTGSNGALVGELRHDDVVGALAFSPKGELVTGTDDGRVHRWVETDGRYERTSSERAHRGAVTTIVFAETGNRFATGSIRGDVRAWSGGRPGEPLLRHRGAIRDLTFLADADELVSAGEDGRAVVWKLAGTGEGVTGTVASEFLGHGGRAILSVAYGASANRVATGGADGRILLWDPANPGSLDIEARIRRSLGNGGDAAPVDEWRFVAITPSSGVAAHGEGVRSLRFSGDGTRLVSGSADRTVRVWDLVSGETPGLVKTLEGHGDAVNAIAVVGDGANGVLSIDDAGARFWNVARYREQGVVTERVIEGHAEKVTSVGFDPRTGRILSTSADHTARRWNPLTGAELVTYRDGHDVLASAAAFVPVDGEANVIATAAAFVGEVRLWDVVTGTERAHVSGTGRNAALAVSPDGRWMATGGDDDAVLLWDVADVLANGPNAEPRRRLTFHRSPVSALGFSPDSRRLYSGDDDGVVLEWAVATGRSNRLGAHWGRVNAIVVLANGDVLSASTDKTVERWSRTEGELRKAERPLAHPGSVVGLAAAADGRTFVTVARDESRNDLFVMQQWNAATNAVARRIPIRSRVVSGVALDPANPDRAITVEGGENLRLWTISTGQPEQPRIPAWSAVFSPKGDRIVTVGGSNATLWAVGDGGLDRLRRFEPHGTVNAAAHSADGRFVASVGSEGALKIWPAADLADETPAAAYTVTSGQTVPGGTMHTGSVATVAFLPTGPVDGAYELATGGADGTVKLWQWTPGPEPSVRLLRTVVDDDERSPVEHLAFSTSGDRFVTAHRDGRAIVRSRVDPDAKPIVLGDGGEPLRSAAFSPVPTAEGGLLVATAGDDDTIRLWSIADGAVVGEPAVLTGHGGDVTSVAWSEDGRRLLSGSLDGTAKIWDTPISRIEESGRNEARELLTLEPTGERSGITSVAFSPKVEGEPTSVLTASENGSMTLWMAAPTGEGRGPRIDAD